DVLLLEVAEAGQVGLDQRLEMLDPVAEPGIDERGIEQVGDEVAELALVGRLNDGLQRLLRRRLRVGLGAIGDAVARRNLFRRLRPAFLGQGDGPGPEQNGECTHASHDEPPGLLYWLPRLDSTATGYTGGMAGNTFGQLFRVTTAGVSHGP